MIRIVHYRDKCIGCFGCVAADKYRWRISRRDGKSVLIDGEGKNGIFTTTVEEDEMRALMMAKNNCPVNIIKVELVH